MRESVEDRTGRRQANTDGPLYVIENCVGDPARDSGVRFWMHFAAL
jgi:hypothetical protein